MTQRAPVQQQQPQQQQRIGEYLLGSTVGKGSFGKVRKGTHIPTGRQVAIKVLNRAALQSSKMDVKIRREIRILKLFNHPNVCRLYDVVYTASDIFVVQEFVEGGELYDHIVNKGKLPESEARHIFQQIVCALEYCHHYRVVHRDLKPENILLSRGKKGDAKLIDFGLANIMQDGEFLRTSCGSPNYAAPEVISGRLYAGPEVDVWSCGVVLFALLCGCLPFDEETIPALFRRIKEGRYSVPSHVSDSARDLIGQLLTVDPMARATIPQIRDHPWFATDLPKHLHYRPSLFNAAEYIDEDVLFEASEMAQVNIDSLRAQIVERASAPSSAPSGREVVLYDILADTKRQRDIESDTGGAPADVVSASSGSTGGGGAKVTAFQRELNMGLMLSTSPALATLLDEKDATTNKRAYNATTFLPASVQDVVKGAQPKQPSSASPGAFSFHGNPTSLTERVGSYHASLTERAASLHGGSHPLGGASIDGRTPSSGVAGERSNSSRPLVGSVARTAAVYDTEEEVFNLQNNCGWRIGLMTDQKSAIAVNELCNVLRELKFEWKTRAPFVLSVRYKRDSLPAADPATPGLLRVVLHLHIMRIQEKHEKGYVVDFRVAKGNTMPALETAIKIWTRIHSHIG